MKHTLHYNEMVRFYDRSRKKLQSLIARGKNFRKQDILKKRIARLFALLSGMQSGLKKATATAALGAGMILLQPSEAKAFSFGPAQTNPFGGISAPYGLNPALADMDNDGDPDLISFRFGDPAFPVSLYYWENTGSATSPSYPQKNLNAFSYYTGGSNPNGSKTIAVADMDHDGDLDILAGSEISAPVYFPNLGSPTSPDFSSMGGNTFGISGSHGFISPTFVDIDADGDYDLVFGALDGAIYYQMNTGTASSPSFGPDALLIPAQSGFPSGYYNLIAPSASFADLDNDGDLDLVVGSYANPVQTAYFENTGSSTSFQFTAGTIPFVISTSFDFTSSNKVEFGDLDNDGDMDILSNFTYYENTTPIPPSSIPTLSEWALISLAALMAGVGVFTLRNRIG